MARLEGFEPPTPGLEGQCSIQLSYRRVQVFSALSGRVSSQRPDCHHVRHHSGSPSAGRPTPLPRNSPRGEGPILQRGSPPPHARPVNRFKWCRLTARGGTELRCQRPALVGSDYCERHDPTVKAARQEREARTVLLMTLGGTPGALLALLLTVVDAGRVNWCELHRLAVAARLMAR